MVKFHVLSTPEWLHICNHGNHRILGCDTLSKRKGLKRGFTITRPYEALTIIITVLAIVDRLKCLQSRQRLPVDGWNACRMTSNWSWLFW